jgi:hypothetical protein
MQALGTQPNCKVIVSLPMLARVLFWRFLAHAPAAVLAAGIGVSLLVRGYTISAAIYFAANASTLFAVWRDANTAPGTRPAG